MTVRPSQFVSHLCHPDRRQLRCRGGAHAGGSDARVFLFLLRWRVYHSVASSTVARLNAVSHGESAGSGGDGGGESAAVGGGDGSDGGDVIDAIVSWSSTISASSAAHDDALSSSQTPQEAMHLERAWRHFLPDFFGLGHLLSTCGRGARM